MTALQESKKRLRELPEDQRGTVAAYFLATWEEAQQPDVQQANKEKSTGVRAGAV